MKRILCAILAVLMLCTMSVAMVSCGVSMESIEEKCEKLKKDGEIADFKKTETMITAWTSDYKQTFTAKKFENADKAKEAYEELDKQLEELKKEDKEEAKELYLKRKGEIVIYGTKDLCKKIV